MTELEILEVRMREHEIAAMHLRLTRAQMHGATSSFKEEIILKIDSLECYRDAFARHLEKQGHDYFTITSEMARIRAEVRGAGSRSSNRLSLAIQSFRWVRLEEKSDEQQSN